MASLEASSETIRRNLERVRARIDAACERSDRDPRAVRICVACKYVAPETMSRLAEAGVSLVGENRLQDLVAKQQSLGAAFEWHFIGALQSRKVPEIARRVSLIHSLCTETAAQRLHGLEEPPPDVLVQVNVSGEETKQGIAPGDLGAFCESLPKPPIGLMTMPPPTPIPEQARPYFRRLAELAAERGLEQLSIGTSQDFEVAVEEGATIVRIGAALFEPTA